MKQYFFDSNIFLRHLTKDDPTKAKDVQKLFADIDEGLIVAFTSVMVVAEVVWVIETQYKLPKAAYVGYLESLFSHDLVSFLDGDKGVALSALALYREYGIDFIDAYNWSLVKKEKAMRIYSYDKDFDLLGSERKEP